MEKVGGNSNAAKISKAYELMLYKSIPQNRLKVFEELYAKALVAFKNNASNASAFMGDKQKKFKPEEAAMVLVANAMLNLDEVVTKN
ncbi:hypothetical protein D3C87_648900 [compost metagenome]